MSIVISAPHAFCTDNPARHCDRVAAYAATFIYAKLPADLREKSHLHINRKLREEADMNRAPNRKRKFRKDLSALMAGAKWLLDVHSFPPMVAATYGYYEVAVVDGKVGTAYCEDLATYLRTCGCRAGRMQANDLFDIISDAREQGLYSIMLEFDEALEPFRISQIAEMIGEWLANNISPNVGSAPDVPVVYASM